jgi:hypothetical protein
MITSRRTAFGMLASMLLTNRVLLSQPGLPQSASASQSQGSIDPDIDLLRKDIRSQKKQVIAANLSLSDKESEQFWPIYDQYTAELVKINDKKYKALDQYAENYGALTDDQAIFLLGQVLEVDQSVAQLRQKYVPIVGKVLSGKKTATFFQLDHRLVMLIDLKLASALPLVEPS